MRHAVFEHPAVARAVRDHVVERLRIDPFAQAERHRFGCRRDVHAREQLVDHLDLAAGAGLVVELVDLGRHRVQKRVGNRIGFGAAGRHHRDLAGCRARRAAGDRRVQVQEARVRELRLDLFRPVRVHRRAHHEHAAGLHCVRHAAAVALAAPEHGLGLLGVHDHRDHDVARGADLVQAVAGDPAVFGERARRIGPQVEHLDRMARAPQRLRHAAAHCAEADQADRAVRCCRHALPAFDRWSPAASASGGSFKAG